MWIATKFGFYSIVQTRQNNNQFMVRARAQKDLENLKESLSTLKNTEIKVTKDADYHFRMIISVEDLNQLMLFFAKEVDYTNFKDKVYTIANQKDKLPSYHDIWSTMYRYQNS